MAFEGIELKIALIIDTARVRPPRITLNMRTVKTVDIIQVKNSKNEHDVFMEGMQIQQA